jgi:dCMP deaminase
MTKPTSRYGAHWDKRFLALAQHFTQWSKDPSTKVGAVIVGPDSKRQISHGYNGFPEHEADDHRLHIREEKYRLVYHAERNAIQNALFDTKGSTIYVSHVPCAECAKRIVAAGIVRVVAPETPNDYTERWKSSIEDATKILDDAQVSLDLIQI